MIGNIDDYVDCLGDIEGVPSQDETVNPKDYLKTVKTIARRFPHLKAICVTLLKANRFNFNDWAAFIYAEGKLSPSPICREIEILDRVGAGDAFASGVIHAFLERKGPQAAVNYGVAHASLQMTTPGDSSMTQCRRGRSFDEKLKMAF